jgi:hypothetical protein
MGCAGDPDTMIRLALAVLVIYLGALLSASAYLK